jgi:WD40 repeat protein
MFRSSLSLCGFLLLLLPCLSLAQEKSLFSELRRFGPAQVIGGHAALSRDGSMVAVSYQEESDSVLGVFETSTGKQLLREKGYVHDLAWNGDSQLFVLVMGTLGGTQVHRVNFAERAPRLAPLFVADRTLAASSAGYDLAVSPDGKRIAFHDPVAGNRGRLSWWDLSGRELGRVQGGTIAASDFSNAVGLPVWNGMLYRQPRGALGKRTLAFSSDGRLLAAAHADKTLRVWDVAKKTEVRRIELTHPGPSIAFLDAERMVIGGAGLGLRIVQARTGKVLHELAKPSADEKPAAKEEGFNAALLGTISETGLVAAFRHPDGKTLLALSAAGEWQFFDGSNGKKLELEGPKQLFEGGRFLGFGSKGKYASVVRNDPMAGAASKKDKASAGALAVWELTKELPSSK